MTKDESQKFGEQIVSAIRSFVQRSLAQRDKRLDALEKMIHEMELQTKAFRYVGTWEAGRKYVEGNFVSSGGSLWHCRCETGTRPGHGDQWTLAVKCGRDGRDLR